MNASTTDAAGADERTLIRRFRSAPLGPYDAELRAFLLPLRNLPAAGKHALLRLPDEAA